MSAKWSREMACWKWDCIYGCSGFDCESQWEAEQAFLHHRCSMGA